MSLYEQEPFATFDLLVRQRQEDFGSLGLFAVARLEEEDTRLSLRTGYLYRHVDSGHVFRLGFSKLKLKKLYLVDAYIVRTDGKTLSVRDYVRLHPETGHTEEEFDIIPEGTDLYVEGRRVLTLLFSVLREQLKPILQGFAWENVQIDFQGWK